MLINGTKINITHVRITSEAQCETYGWVLNNSYPIRELLNITARDRNGLEIYVFSEERKKYVLLGDKEYELPYDQIEFNFWKENNLDQHYTIVGTDLLEKFITWCGTKEKAWLQSTGHVLAYLVFTGDKEGLNSVNEQEEHELAYRLIEKPFKELLKK